MKDGDNFFQHLRAVVEDTGYRYDPNSPETIKLRRDAWQLPAKQQSSSEDSLSRRHGRQHQLRAGRARAGYYSYDRPADYELSAKQNQRMGLARDSEVQRLTDKPEDVRAALQRIYASSDTVFISTFTELVPFPTTEVAAQLPPPEALPQRPGFMRGVLAGMREKLQSRTARRIMVGATAVTAVVGLGFLSKANNPAGEGASPSAATATLIEPEDSAVMAPDLSDAGEEAAAVPVITPAPEVEASLPVEEAAVPPLVLAPGETVWDKASDAVAAAGVAEAEANSDATRDIVAHLRAANPDLDLDLRPVGEQSFGISAETIKQFTSSA